ncbi:MAG: alanine racemase [Faecalimonas sp.]|nr:alanine racemase [Faecalimonas sp.]
MKTYSRVYARIDLDAITSNMERMKQNLNPSTKMMAVIKADGYGHGAVPIAQMLEEVPYVWGFAVATLDEAIVLRTEGIQKPILVLGCVFPDQYMEMLKHSIRMNVYTEEMAEAISHMAEQENMTAYMHIKLDTGMTRLGFDVSKESVESITRIAGLNNVCMEGIFTHFAKADEIDKTFTQKQIRDFIWMTERLKENHVTFQYEHCANSAAIIDVPEANFDLVRSGISTYGLYPSEDVCKEKVILKPALSLKSHVAFVKGIDAKTPISYGGTYLSEDRMKIATIPVGYADGYPRNLSNVGYVLIRGKKAPIVGRVCMDQFMVDVTDIDGVSFGDAVTLIGKDGNETITVEELSELSGRFNYEFVCDLGKRIPRVFVKDGKILEQVDYFA